MRFLLQDVGSRLSRRMGAPRSVYEAREASQASDQHHHGGTDADLAGTLEAMAADRPNFLRALSEGICAGDTSEATIQWMWQIFMDGSPLAARSLAELGPLDQRAILSDLDVPILSFVGGSDAVVDPAVCRSVADYHKDTRTVEFEHVGHAPQLEKPAGYHEALVAFLNEKL